MLEINLLYCCLARIVLHHSFLLATSPFWSTGQGALNVSPCCGTQTHLTVSSAASSMQADLIAGEWTLVQCLPLDTFLLLTKLCCTLHLHRSFQLFPSFQAEWPVHRLFLCLCCLLASSLNFLGGHTPLLTSHPVFQ